MAEPRRAAPVDRRQPPTGRWRAWRSPATRSGSASGSARPSRRRSRTSRSSGSPRNGTPGHHRRAVPDPERAGPGLTGPGSLPRGRGPAAPTSGSTPRRTSSRTTPSTATALLERAMRARRRLGRPRRARPRLRHRLPPAALRGDRGSRVRRRAASRPAARWPRGVPGRWPNVTRAGRHRPGACRCPTRRWTSCTRGGRTSSGPGCEPGLRRARPRRTPRGHGVRDRQRRRPGRRSAAGSGAATRRSTRSPSSGSGPATAGPARRSTSTGASTTAADLEAVVRIEFTPEVADAILAEHAGTDGRLRRQPVVAPVLSPTDLTVPDALGSRNGQVHRSTA